MREWTAYDIIEELGEEMDLMRDPMGRKWRCYLSPKAYDILKNDTSRADILELTGEDACWIYTKDGKEYLKVWDNQRIPFIIHMRIAGEILGNDGEPTDEVSFLRELDEMPG